LSTAPGFEVEAKVFFTRFVAAQRFRCASAIRFLASGLKVRFAAFSFLGGLAWPTLEAQAFMLPKKSTYLI
jgi:hypothetical protein